ncbi:MAG TPA: 2-oxoacid:acceptor oxidoreductase family protein [Polyangiaceae bacterium]
MKRTTSVIFAGLGGQGVLTTAEILAQAAFRAGHDVKKSEVHGMAQRGGLVVSDVRFGTAVFSPMTALGEADCLVLLDSSQLDAVADRLRKGGVLITPEHAELRQMHGRRNSNMAMLGIAARGLGIASRYFESPIHAALKPELRESSVTLFRRFADATCDLADAATAFATPPRSPNEQAGAHSTTEQHQ